MKWWDCLSQTMHQWHSLAVGHMEMWWDFLTFRKCAIWLTYCWSSQKMWWDYLSQNMHCYSQTVGHRKICDETALHKTLCNVTHSLLPIGKDVMRLPFTKIVKFNCSLAVTNSWSLNQVTKRNSISLTRLSQLGQDKTREALRFAVA
jgi:hypothetical protein